MIASKLKLHQDNPLAKYNIVTYNRIRCFDELG